MSGAQRAGIEHFVIVVAHQGQGCSLVRRHSLTTPVTWVENTEYHKKNGVSLAQGQIRCRPAICTSHARTYVPVAHAPCLLSQPLANNETILVVDHKLDGIFHLTTPRRWCAWVITSSASGKDLKVYDAVDTRCSIRNLAVFDVLDAVDKGRQLFLTDGMQYMASNRKRRAYDIEDAIWQDIDTPETLDRQVEWSPHYSHPPGRWQVFSSRP